MLQAGMEEEQKGRVKVEDAEPVILKELLLYLYTGNIGADFREYKELMILANKYQVEELVDYTSNKILESLTEDNALKLGIFGEMYNSSILLNGCAKFIQENVVKTLPAGWDKEVEKYPRLMVAVIEAVRKEAGKVTEFARFSPGSGSPSVWGVGPGAVDALRFKVSTKAKLVGVGMYGEKGSDNKVSLKIYQGDQLLFQEEKEYHSEGGEVYTNLQLKTAVELEANTLYDLTVERLSDGTLWAGEDGQSLVQAGKLEVTFSDSERDINSTSDQDGQIPAIYLA